MSAGSRNEFQIWTESKTFVCVYPLQSGTSDASRISPCVDEGVIALADIEQSIFALRAVR